MNTENWTGYSMDSEPASLRPSPPFYLINSAYDHANYPTNSPFPAPFNQATQDFNATQNHSGQSCFPPQLLQGPGQTGHPLPTQAGYPLPTLTNCPPPVASHKRKRTTSPERTAAGGYGLIVSPGPESVQTTVDPAPTIKFTKRKNAAYNVWPFVRALTTNEAVPVEMWPSDYNQHSTKRLDKPFDFVGCKLCTEFG